MAELLRSIPVSEAAAHGIVFDHHYGAWFNKHNNVVPTHTSNGVTRLIIA